MRSSTVKREKLINPVNIALIGGLFAASFYLLKPSGSALEFDGTREASMPGAAAVRPEYVDELDLAYIKARSASGIKSTPEIVAAAVALVKSGNVKQAKALLADHPNLDINENERFSIELEISAYEYSREIPGTNESVGETDILAKLDLLLMNPEFQTLTNLKRAAVLAVQLEKLSLQNSFFLKLADIDKAKASYWFERCANLQVAQQLIADGLRCLDKAIASSQSETQTQTLKIQRLNVLAMSKNDYLLDQEVTQLMQDDGQTFEQTHTLAKTFLGVERPAAAAQMFARMAQMDEPQAAHWYNEAATWAEAGGRSELAIQYLDYAASRSSGDQKRQLTLRADTLLVASGHNAEAFNRVKERIQTQSNDIELLRTGISLARQFNELEQAARWNVLLLNIAPNDAQSLALQVRLAMGQKDLDSAKRWAIVAAERSPEDVDAKLMLARLYEWTGEPNHALSQWRWIARKKGDASSYRQLIRLAKMNRDSRAASTGLQALVRLERPSNETVDDLIANLELEGSPLAAADAIKNLMALYGNRAYFSQQLAKLYQRHILYADSLAAWQQFAELYGDSNESILARIELLWRTNDQQAASELATYLTNENQLTMATSYQISLLAELAWRFRHPQLAAIVSPHLKKVEDEQSRIARSRRLIEVLETSGDKEAAIKEAVSLWQSSRSTDSALLAMRLALKVEDQALLQQLMAKTPENVALRQNVAFWNMAASVHLRAGNQQAAQQAYASSLSLDPLNESALSGLLWMYIGAQDTQAIEMFHQSHMSTMHATPALWSAVAISYLQLGNPQQSLLWFDKQIEAIDADYGMLLSYADALEYAGHAENAHKVRLYTLRKLRPLLAKGASDDQTELLKQYVQLLFRYGSADQSERVVQQLLKSPDVLTGPDKFWREDVAISWLMATQRHEHARVVMSQLHEERLNTPVWQALALAMHQQDIPTVRAILAGTGNVSLGNQILALRTLGNDKDAFSLASGALTSAPSKGDRDIAVSQYLSLRDARPSFSSGSMTTTTLNGLGISQAGVQARHTLKGSNFGFGFDYFKREYTSKKFSFADNYEREHIIMAMYFGGRFLGGQIKAGVINASDADTLYASTRYHLRSRAGNRQISAEIAYNEEATQSAELRLAAMQNRLSIDAESNFGKREYIRLKANVNEISTRVAEKKIARGLATEVEVGVRGAFGSNNWSTSIRANRSQYSREDTLPEELQLSPESSMSSVVGEDATTLSLGATLARGGVGENFPLASTPRYYLNASMGQSWPSTTLGFQLDAGAGIRILGADELSIGFSHDTQAGSQAGKNSDATALGVNYRYHF